MIISYGLSHFTSLHFFCLATWFNLNRPSTAHQDSAELSSSHPSVFYCLHPLVQQMLVTLLVRTITDKSTEISEEEELSLLRSRLYSLLSISTESNEVMLVTVQRLEEALTLCYEIQDTVSFEIRPNFLFCPNTRHYSNYRLSFQNLVLIHTLGYCKIYSSTE